MIFLPTLNLFDEVHADTGRLCEHGHRIYDESISFKRKIIAGWFCHHRHPHAYVRIDERTGPGSHATNYEGVACIDCGRILMEKELWS